MTLWTIQPLEIWQLLQNQGVFHSHPKDLNEDFADAYQWMIEQLTHRVGKPPAGCQWPIWAWYQYSSRAKPKPDLRRSAHLPTGTIGVRMELEIEDSQVLLSDFELWHHALNYQYLSESEEDDEVFEQELAQQGLSPYNRQFPPLPSDYDAKIRKSWQRIFDLDWASEYHRPRFQKTIQAVFWELRIEQVRKVDRFKAR
jgi:Domain of unknown function (DUF3841)